MKQYTKYSELKAPWKNDQKTRETLIDRIRLSAARESDSSASVFTEEKIAEEYYKAWVDMAPTAVLQKIVQHPLMDKETRAKVDEQLEEQKKSQMKWASGCTGVSLLIYAGLFSRMPRFQSFFNHPNSWFITRAVKKTLGVYFVFVIWVASLTSSY